MCTSNDIAQTKHRDCKQAATVKYKTIYKMLETCQSGSASGLSRPSLMAEGCRLAAKTFLLRECKASLDAQFLIYKQILLKDGILSCSALRI